MLSDIFGSNKPRCQHFHEDGKRCAANPQTNNKFCFMHDPEQKEKQAEARKKGGQARFQLWERKVPHNFKYRHLKDEDQVGAFIDKIAAYYAADLMDLRSARFFIYVANCRLAHWNAKERRQYRAVKVAEQQARILARETDPWSPAHGVLRRAAKAKEEAAKTAGDNQTSPYEVHPIIAAAVAEPAMPSDVALSFRELDELQKEEERKEQERARDRKRAEQAPAAENDEPNYSEDAGEAALPMRPPQPVPPAPASRGVHRGSVHTEDEQRQQRLLQHDMNQLAECVGEQVRNAAAAKAKKYGWKKRGGTKY